MTIPNVPSNVDLPFTICMPGGRHWPLAQCVACYRLRGETGGSSFVEGINIDRHWKVLHRESA